MTVKDERQLRYLVSFVGYRTLFGVSSVVCCIWVFLAESLLLNTLFLSAQVVCIIMYVCMHMCVSKILHGEE